MTPEHERWAEALLVHKLHGEAAMNYVSTRIMDMVREGDSAGIQRWTAIAVRIDQLGGGTTQ